MEIIEIEIPMDEIDPYKTPMGVILKVLDSILEGAPKEISKEALILDTMIVEVMKRNIIEKALPCELAAIAGALLLGNKLPAEHSDPLEYIKTMYGKKTESEAPLKYKGETTEGGTTFREKF
jgi:hypothetical protein